MRRGKKHRSVGQPEKKPTRAGNEENEAEEETASAFFPDFRSVSGAAGVDLRVSSPPRFAAAI